jgi:hypothetical protein
VASGCSHSSIQTGKVSGNHRAILTFLIGIVSEQISALHYKGMDGGEK